MVRKIFKSILLLLSALIPVIFGIGIIILVAQPWALWGQDWFIEEGDDKAFIAFVKRGASILFIFTLTCYIFLHLIKKRKIKITYWIIGLSYLIITLISAFRVNEYTNFREHFFSNGIEFMWIGCLWVSFICLPLFLIIIHANWLYGKNLKSWFKKYYYPLLNWVIATPIFLIIGYNSKTIFHSLNTFEWNFSTTRNIITIAFALLVLVIGRNYVSYRVISRNNRKGFLPIFVQISRFVIGTLVASFIILLTLIFVNVDSDANAVLFYNDFSASFSNAIRLFPQKAVWFLLGIHFFVWAISRIGDKKKQVTSYSMDDPWLPQNVIELIPDEILEVEKMTKWNHLSNENINKAMKNADVGLEKLHAQKVKYNQYLERWKNMETLSDQDWIDFGNKKGTSRPFQYSRFSVGYFKECFLEKIFEVDYYIRETNRIQTKFLGKEILDMAFQETEGHNISGEKTAISDDLKVKLSLVDDVVTPPIKKINTEDFE